MEGKKYLHISKSTAMQKDPHMSFQNLLWQHEQADTYLHRFGVQ